MTISEFAPDTNCCRNGSGIISDFDSTAPPGIGSRDHSRRLDSSPVEQAKKWLIPIHRRANLTGTTSGVQRLVSARLGFRRQRRSRQGPAPALLDPLGERHPAYRSAEMSLGAADKSVCARLMSRKVRSRAGIGWSN